MQVRFGTDTKGGGTVTAAEYLVSMSRQGLHRVGNQPSAEEAVRMGFICGCLLPPRWLLSMVETPALHTSKPAGTAFAA